MGKYIYETIDQGFPTCGLHVPCMLNTCIIYWINKIMKRELWYIMTSWMNRFIIVANMIECNCQKFFWKSFNLHYFLLHLACLMPRHTLYIQVLGGHVPPPVDISWKALPKTLYKILAQGSMVRFHIQQEHIMGTYLGMKVLRKFHDFRKVCQNFPVFTKLYPVQKNGKVQFLRKLSSIIKKFIWIVVDISLIRMLNPKWFTFMYM